MKRVFFFPSYFQSFVSIRWVIPVIKILSEILSDWHLRRAFPPIFPLKDTSTQPAFNSPRSEIVTDPGRMTQMLKGLFTKERCFTTLARAWHILIKKFEFHPGSILPSFMNEKTQDLSCDDLLGNEIFIIHQPFTYPNLWISQPAYILLFW